MDNNTFSYTLGLTIGITSVGAALLTDDHIIALHVRTFNKAETGDKGESLNKIRRDARLQRRTTRRRAFRLLRLRRLFKKIGLIDSQEAVAFSLSSPWQLRAEGLDRILTPTEWASVLYHIVKHRGFQTSRKSEAKVDEKIGQMLNAIKTNQERCVTGNWRTLGEMLWKDSAFQQAKRNKMADYSHTFDRKDVEQELTELFAKQRALGNPYTNTELEEKVCALLMARKPTLSGNNLLKMVGKCSLEPNEFRAPKASYTAERFVWLTKLNNLYLAHKRGGIRTLTNEERTLLLSLPFTQTKLTYKQIRNKLGLDDNDHFIGLNYHNPTKDPETAIFFEAKAFHALRKAYESHGLDKQWQRDSINPDKLDTIAYSLTVFKEDNESRQWLLNQHIEAEVVDAVLEESFSEFLRLSIKALKRLLPFMEKGSRYDEAVERIREYALHNQIPKTAKQGNIPQISKDDISNPVVYRAVNQARKLVNAIVYKYGRPTHVQIELGRDLNKSFDERKKIEREQNSRREAKVKDIEQFEEQFQFPPKGLHFQKWRLYREQNGQCPYCQQPLDLMRLFEIGYAEIDFVLPYSRSFDNSLNNKVIAHKHENQNKGNRTPHEYLTDASENEQWLRFVAWVESNKNYRLQKRQYLLRENFSAENAREFQERNFTDTRYASKLCKQMVENHLGLKCVVTSWRLTNLLSARWGLVNDSKDSDLRYGIDAAIIAATSQGLIKRISYYSRCKELAHVRSGFIDPETGEILNPNAHEIINNHFPKPWENFREDLLNRLTKIHVSRAPLRRGLGALHAETIRSAKHLHHKKSSVKTPLSKLKLKDLPNIVGYNNPRNTSLIAAIEQRLKEHADDGAKAFKEPLRHPTAAEKEHLAPIVRGVNLLTTQKNGVRVRHGIADNGAMLRVDIFSDGKKFYGVPLYVHDAIKNLPNEAVSSGKNGWISMGDDYRFLFSLHPNDFVRLTLKDEVVEGYFNGMDIATGALSLFLHDQRGQEKKIRRGFLRALSLEKFHVDMLGRLYCVHHEERRPLRKKQVICDLA